MSVSEPDSSRKALSYKGYRFFWLTSMAIGFAVQIMSVAVAWQIYELTRSPLLLGFVGLALFLPALSLVFVTGAVADRVSRRTIMVICLVVELVCGVVLFANASVQTDGVWVIFIVLVVLGTARAFRRPASDSLAPNLVPAKALANAISMNASASQLSSILGPVVGGLLYGLGGQMPYGAAVALVILSIVLVPMIPAPAQHSAIKQTTLENMLGGVRFVLKERAVLGAISLDMFAVLLGGARALMPIYALDILNSDATGLGLLRAAPGVGALGMALWLSRRPVRDRAGYLLFAGMGGFGVFTIIFGFSTSLWVAILAMVALGLCDMVNVTIRETIIQLRTPDELRGRVSAVNRVFFGASNELGEARAGIMAAWVGAVAAVVAGGIATVVVTGLWARWFPELLHTRSLEK